MIETGHYRHLLRRANVKVLSVTEDYLARDGIDGDVLPTVRQFQNRQFSISLPQSTPRRQISAALAESDPGRAASFGYDREIIAPDGSVLFRKHLRRPNRRLAFTEARRDAAEPRRRPPLETKRPPQRTVAGKPDRGDRV